MSIAGDPSRLVHFLKAVAAGCTAMMGVEAISNGVPAFKNPGTRNAAARLIWMAVILGSLFLGITQLATSYHVEANPAGNPTAIGARCFGASSASHSADAAKVALLARPGGQEPYAICSVVRQWPGSTASPSA